jgi:hypothetical protein
MPKADAHHTHVCAVVELQQRYEGQIPATELAAAQARDFSEQQRFQRLSPREQAVELIASQALTVADERRFIRAILLKRREARAFLQSNIGQRVDFGLLVRTKATLDAAERDARFQIKFYRANRALLLKFRADLAAASSRVAA